MHRAFAKGESYFLTNRQSRQEQIEARFRVTDRIPELWRPETGEREPVSYRIEQGETVVPLTLQSDDAVHIVFRGTADKLARSIEVPTFRELARLDKSWRIAFQAGRGAPLGTVLQPLAPLDEASDPRIRFFSGMADYRQTFTAPRGWQPGAPLWLDLGEVHEVAEIVVNGQKAGDVWHAPYRVNIGKLVRAGKNRLDVRVANLWANRLIGDARRDPADPSPRLTWTAGPSYTASAPLRRSGLIGPVRLLGAAGPTR